MIQKTKTELQKEVNRLLRENKKLFKKLESLPDSDSSNGDYKLLNVIFDNVKLGILLIDKTGRLIKVNKTLTTLIGYKSEELLKMKFTDLSHPHDKDISIKLFKEILSGKRDSYEISKRYIHKKGHILWGKVAVTAIKDKQKNIQYLIAIALDITDQIEIEKKLESEQNLFKTIMDSVPDSIYFKDRNSKFFKVNKAKSLKHGFKNPEDLVGKSDFDLFDNEHANKSFIDEQSIIESGKTIIGKEEKQIYKNGATSWVSTTKLPLTDIAGNVIGTFGITRDIKQQKLYEEALFAERERYRILFESSVDGIFIMTDLFEDCNSAVCKLFACERDDIIGHSPIDFSPEYQPDGRLSSESAKEKIDAAFKGIPQRFYWKHTRKDGKLIDCEVALQSLTINNRNLIQATVRDISDRYRAEKLQDAIYKISEAALESEDINKLYQRIHEIIGQLMPAKNFYIALYDEKTDLLTFPYFVDEYDPPQPPKKLGRGLTEYVIRKGEAVLIDAKKDLELREKGEVELIGEPQAIWLGIPLRLNDKIIGVMVVQDYNDEFAYGENEMQLLTFVSEQISQAITRRKNSEAIKKYAEELHQLNTTKDKFFSIIAHDLKNPFITILGFTDLLQSDFGELTDEEKLYYIQEMNKSAQISHNLLQNLLQWSRSQTGRIEFNPTKLNLANLVKDNINLLNATASNKQIELTSEIQDDTFVFADEDMINTVLRNLISNAIKFTPQKKSIKISSRFTNGFLETCVEDTGIGMNEETLNKLFRLDVSHSSKGTEEEAGTGLGLILCKEFVEKNSGKIRVESKPGKGSKFIFTLKQSL